MGIKDLFLNKGWAGQTLSREETAARLDPIIRRHCELTHIYDQAIRNLGEGDAPEPLHALQKTARADIGKLSEAVLSAGETPYAGGDLEPEDFDTGASIGDTLRELRRLETGFQALLEAELGIEHTMHTRAVLGAVLGNSKARLVYVRELARTYR